ncbi:MAG: LysR family transcriptional regulator [Methylococcaceae bacterium]|nr:LysR family transcriptional regulator [Methylococcaceae bacterium]
MNPSNLLTFAVVARFNSITKAAHYLHLGQPAVSGQLKLLQTTVGEPLYERRGHQIELTAAGRGLLEYAEKMNNNFQQAQEYINKLQKINGGSLHLAATMTVASYYLPKHVVQLQTLHSGVQVFLETFDTQEIVRNIHDFDLGFVEGAVETEQLPINYQVIPWQQDEIVLVLAENHSLAKKYPESVPLEVFTEHQVIWRESGSGARKTVENALEAAGICAPVTIEVTGVTGVKESVRAGLGIGFSSSQALRNEIKGLVARRINPPHGLTWQLNIIAPKEMIQSRVAKAFLKLCTG